MKIIKTVNNKEIIIDEEDYEYLNQFKWYMNTDGYAQRIISIHREIMKNPEGVYVDHINGNPSDNRKSNLRLVTHQQNSINRKKTTKKKTSQYKGVCYIKKCTKRPWLACIKTNGKSIHLGYFSTEKEAAEAYNKKALELFGEFASLNSF